MLDFLLRKKESGKAFEQIINSVSSDDLSPGLKNAAYAVFSDFVKTNKAQSAAVVHFLGKIPKDVLPRAIGLYDMLFSYSDLGKIKRHFECRDLINRDGQLKKYNHILCEILEEQKSSNMYSNDLLNQLSCYSVKSAKERGLLVSHTPMINRYPGSDLELSVPPSIKYSSGEPQGIPTHPPLLSQETCRRIRSNENVFLDLSKAPQTSISQPWSCKFQIHSMIEDRKGTYLSVTTDEIGTTEKTIFTNAMSDEQKKLVKAGFQKGVVPIYSAMWAGVFANKNDDFFDLHESDPEKVEIFDSSKQGKWTMGKVPFPNVQNARICVPPTGVYRYNVGSLGAVYVGDKPSSFLGKIDALTIDRNQIEGENVVCARMSNNAMLDDYFVSRNFTKAQIETLTKAASAPISKVSCTAIRSGVRQEEGMGKGPSIVGPQEFSVENANPDCVRKFTWGDDNGRSVPWEDFPMLGIAERGDFWRVSYQFDQMGRPLKVDVVPTDHHKQSGIVTSVTNNYLLKMLYVIQEVSPGLEEGFCVSTHALKNDETNKLMNAAKNGEPLSIRYHKDAGLNLQGEVQEIKAPDLSLRGYHPSTGRS